MMVIFFQVILYFNGLCSSFQRTLIIKMGSAFLTEPVRTKKTQKFQHRKLRVICSQMQGWRKYMEDAIVFDRIGKQIFLFGIFDGHGGPQISQYSAKYFSQLLQSNNSYMNQHYSKALEQTFQLLDKQIDTEEGERQLRSITIASGAQPFEDGKVGDSVGCTANVILMVGSCVYVANAGDSRAVLSRKGKVVVLSKDHKPDDQGQKKRIIDAGGIVDKGRINGHLNLSRSIGDLHYKRNLELSSDKQVVISKPDIVSVQLSKDDEFIIMGCDGVWQKYENDAQGMIDMIRDERCSGKEPQKVLEYYFDKSLSPNPTTEQLGCDNMSAILIQFNKLLL